MAVIPYPSIDHGFIYDPGKKLDALMADFYEAEHAQTYLFRGEVTSLPYILQQHPNDSNDAVNAVRTKLRNYLLKYYDDVEVEVAEERTESATSYYMKLYVKVYQENLTADLFSRLKVDGNKFEQALATRR